MTTIRRESMFREDKTTQMAARFLWLNNNRMSYNYLLKLLYLADRKMLTRRGHPITYDRWIATDQGPALAATLDLIKNRIPSQCWAKYIKTDQNDVVLCDHPGGENLSQAENKILAEVFEEFGLRKRLDLADLLPELPEWEDPKGNLVEIPYQRVMRAAGFTDTNSAQHFRETDATPAAPPFFPWHRLCSVNGE